MPRYNQPRRTWRYTEEFKTKAVQLSYLEGVQVKEVAETLGIHLFILSRWRKLMFDLERFVGKCKSALDAPNPALQIEILVKEAIKESNGIREVFANATSVEHQGPITFAWRDASLTIADVTTPPGLRSPAHNHKMWAVIGVYDGQEHNRFYTYEDGALVAKGERLLKEGDVVVLDTEVVHAIANPLPMSSGAIHVYGGDLVERSDRSMWNPHTNQREDYDITGLIAYVNELSASQ